MTEILDDAVLHVKDIPGLLAKPLRWAIPPASVDIVDTSNGRQIAPIDDVAEKAWGARYNRKWWKTTKGIGNTNTQMLIFREPSGECVAWVLGLTFKLTGHFWRCVLEEDGNGDVRARLASPPESASSLELFSR